jgi:hypothetical protein
MRHRMASTSEFTKGARRFAYAPCVVLAPVQRSLGQTCRAAFRPLVHSGKSSGLKAALRGMACISVVSIATARRFQSGSYEPYGLSHQIACHPERPRSGRGDLLFRRNGERQIPPRASPSFGMTPLLESRYLSTRSLCCCRQDATGTPCPSRSENCSVIPNARAAGGGICCSDDVPPP